MEQFDWPKNQRWCHLGNKKESTNLIVREITRRRPYHGNVPGWNVGVVDYVVAEVEVGDDSGEVFVVATKLEVENVILEKSLEGAKLGQINRLGSVFSKEVSKKSRILEHVLHVSLCIRGAIKLLLPNFYFSPRPSFISIILALLTLNFNSCNFGHDVDKLLQIKIVKRM